MPNHTHVVFVGRITREDDPKYDPIWLRDRIIKTMPVSDMDAIRETVDRWDRLGRVITDLTPITLPVPVAS